MNQDLLSSIAHALNTGGGNYQVFLRAYAAPLDGGVSSEDLVRRMAGRDAMIENLRPAEPSDVISEIESSLRYPGDSAAGPAASVLESEAFGELLVQLREELRQAVDSSLKVEQFWFKEGHPAYPVFWDFAYLFTGPREAKLLIGSSSD